MVPGTQNVALLPPVGLILPYSLFQPSFLFLPFLLFASSSHPYIFPRPYPHVYLFFPLITFFLLSYYSPPVSSPLLTPLPFLSSSLSPPGWRSRSRNHDFNPLQKSILFPLPAELLQSLAGRTVTLFHFIYLSNRAI